MEWFSYVIAISIGLSAVVSPIATSIINNKHQLSLKKLDMYEDTKRRTLTEFIECAEDYLLNPGYVEQSVKYYASINKLFIYFSNVNIDMFVDFEKYSKLDKYTEATIALTNIVQVLSKEITKE